VVHRSENGFDNVTDVSFSAVLLKRPLSQEEFWNDAKSP